MPPGKHQATQRGEITFQKGACKKVAVPGSLGNIGKPLTKELRPPIALGKRKLRDFVTVFSTSNPPR